MIFDERDIEKHETKEDMRKHHKVTDSQLTFGDLENNVEQKSEKESKKPVKSSSKAKKSVKNTEKTNEVENKKEDALSKQIDENNAKYTNNNKLYEKDFQLARAVDLILGLSIVNNLK